MLPPAWRPQPALKTGGWFRHGACESRRLKIKAQHAQLPRRKRSGLQQVADCGVAALIAIMSLSAALADEAPGLLEDPVVGSFAAATVSRLPMRFPTALLASPR